MTDTRPTFTHEATTAIHFPTDAQFAGFRDEVEARYSATMVIVVRHKVGRFGGWTEAKVHHARGLGAELKGLAYSQFDGNSVNTIYPGE